MFILVLEFNREYPMEDDGKITMYRIVLTISSRRTDKIENVEGITDKKLNE